MCQKAQLFFVVDRIRTKGGRLESSYIWHCVMHDDESSHGVKVEIHRWIQDPSQE